MDLSATVLSLSSFFVGAIFLTVFSYWRKYRGVPPGPFGLPFVGFSPFLGQNPQDTFLKLGRKYGSVFSLSMGRTLTVVLNDYEAIHAAYIDQAKVYAGRAEGFVFGHISTGNDGNMHGIVLQEGEIWKTERRFMERAFKDFQKTSKFEQRILEEVDHLIEIFAENNEIAFDPWPHLFASVSNVICALCFGKRNDHEDLEFQQILQDSKLKAEILAGSGFLQTFPFLRFFPGKFRKMWKSLVEISKRNKKFTRDRVDELKRTNAEIQTPDCYTDAFLLEQQMAPTDRQPAFQDVELFQNLRTFFRAGTVNTSVTLQWILLFTLHHPEVQEEIHRELDKNIGEQNLVTIADRAKLPYLEAVCYEVQRLANASPFGVLRSSLEETTLLGYRIPKRCYIVPNFLSVSTDPKLWKDPLTFNPNRFLDRNGKLFKPAHFIPFSLGERSCVGERLVRMELFLFFANIMQRFEIRAANNATIPSTNQYTTGISCRPLPFDIEVIRRR